jgi:hypothetical protein
MRFFIALIAIVLSVAAQAQTPTFQMQNGPYGATTNAVIPVVCSFENTFNYSQTSVGNWTTYLMPKVSWVAANCPNGGLDFWIKNNQPGAFVRMLTVGTYTGSGCMPGCWVGDTINGNPEEWYFAGDESKHFAADVSNPASDWKCMNCKPGFRQQQWNPALSISATLVPCGGGPCALQPVPGFVFSEQQWLQSGASREKVHIETYVGSSAQGDIVYCDLRDTVTGPLEPPGTAGDPVQIPLPSHAYPLVMDYEVPGGQLQYVNSPGNRASYLNTTALCSAPTAVDPAIYGTSSVNACGTYTLAPQSYQLWCRSAANATLSFGNISGVQYETRGYVHEFGVD